MAHGDKQKAILAQLKLGPATSHAIAKALGMDNNGVRAALSNMEKRGWVKGQRAEKNHRNATPGATWVFVKDHDIPPRAAPRKPAP